MNAKSKVRSAILVGIVGSSFALPLSAVEIVTQEDLVKGIVTTAQLVKVADNAVFLLDTSSSMNDDLEGTETPKIQAVASELKKRNSYFPNVGINMGVYTYTGWKEFLPTQPYDREKVAAALDAVPPKGSGPTPLKKGLENLEDVLKPLSGRTAVFLFSDGEYTGGNPSEVAKRLASTYDVCFYVISTATPQKETTLKQDVASLNACSRLIPLSAFISRPDYTSGALYDVKVTEHVVTTSDKKIVGLKVDNINFAHNETELAAQDKTELDALATFLKNNPKAYAVLAGYTDNTGSRDHNEGLSRSRTEMVANYLKSKGIEDSQMVLFWYGPNNPLVDNDTPENKAKNRRVEINVGGLQA